MDGFDFEIEDLVVWGLGGEDAEQRQEKEKLRERTAPVYSARVVVCVRWLNARAFCVLRTTSRASPPSVSR